MGFPIRKSADQSSFAAPRGLSQRTTSFIASQRQGIHQIPFRHLIVLIVDAHPSAEAIAPRTRLLKSSMQTERDRRIQCFSLYQRKDHVASLASHPKDVCVVRRTANNEHTRKRMRCRNRSDEKTFVSMFEHERACARRALAQKRSDGLPYSRCHSTKCPAQSRLGGGKKCSLLFTKDSRRENLVRTSGSHATSAVRGSGGARRDRTDDLLLAKQALSQLSYGPDFGRRRSEGARQNWWAWEDLNFRPHAYQARALTS